MSNDSTSQIMSLTQLGYLTATGNDATKFLHAQFTNDLEGMATGRWQYTGYCTPKGRLLAFMIALKRDDNDYLLIMDESIIDKFLPRLRMFVMRDDVSIENGTGKLYGAIDTFPDGWVVGMDQPSGAGSAACSETGCLLAIDKQRTLLIDESEQVEGNSASELDWIRQDIVNGIPTVTSETQEAFVPQMVNLDLIGAVNFKKGCYPGQEIVARVHYLGKVKQRMFRLSSATTDATAPGDKIFSAGQADKAAGTVVSAIYENDMTMLLAVLQTKAVIEGASLRLGSADGPELSLLDLPYQIPDLEQASH